ncbi:MAG TPA: hypothetical protein ENJ09_07380 [Planctomycetes bacterium]|nr:hypothetical protein [Planctomycetota bacterium]
MTNQTPNTTGWRRLLSGAGLRGWLRERRRERKELLWQRQQQRDVFRNIILATRRIQDVQRTFAEDVEEVRGLRAHLEHARPEMERLGGALESSQEVFERLSEKLERSEEAAGAHLENLERHLTAHAERLEAHLHELEARLAASEAALAARIDGLAGQGERERLQEMVNSLEATLALRGQELREVRASLAALRAKEKGPKDGDGRAVELLNEQLKAERARRAKIEAQLEEERARTEELEAEVRNAFLRASEDEKARRAMEEASACLEGRIDEMQSLVEGVGRGANDGAPSAAREAAELNALKERLRESEIARLDLEARHERELGDFAEHSRERVAALTARVQELESALAAAVEAQIHGEAACEPYLPELPDEARPSGLSDLMGGSEEAV